MNEIVPDTKGTALHYAANLGHNAIVEVLISSGAKIDPQDHRGQTPLDAACKEGHLPCALTLLKAGASTTLPDNEGQLPIHVAAKHNRVEVIRALLEHGCSPDVVSWKTQINDLFNDFPLSLTVRGGGHH